jgi:hypothetical protein
MATRFLRVELLQGTLDALISVRSFGPAHGHAIAKQLATGQSKWESFSKAMGRVLKPADEETR